MIRLADFTRIACLCHDATHPANYARTRDRLALLGGHCEAFLNGVPGTPGSDGRPIPAGEYDRINDAPPPADYPAFLPPGCWHHDRAFRAVIRRAKADRLPSVLIVEHDLLWADGPGRVAESLAAIDLPGDWALFYLGANHAEHDTAEVPGHPGLLRLSGSYCVHAVAVRDIAYDAVLGLPHDGPMDWMLGRYVHPAMPCYAAWPSVAVQEAGWSDVWGRHADYLAAFRSKGRNWPGSP